MTSTSNSTPHSIHSLLYSFVENVSIKEVGSNIINGEASLLNATIADNNILFDTPKSRTGIKKKSGKGKVLMPCKGNGKAIENSQPKPKQGAAPRPKVLRLAKL